MAEGNENATNPQQVPPTPQAPHTLSTIKLPILKKEFCLLKLLKRFWQKREKEKQGLPCSWLPEDYLAKFPKMTNAKEMWEAIKSKFGGNDEYKKMQKYLLKQQFESFSVSNSEGLHKGYDMFQSLLSQLETHAAGVSTEDANQKFLSGPQLDHEDLEQVVEFDLEEMDLKWQVAMISTRLKKFYKKTKRKLHFYAKEHVGFDKRKVECFNCHNIRHFARECRSKRNQDSRRRDAGNTGYKSRDNGKRPVKQDEHKAMVTIDGECVD
nr:ribonuclease H-like domain-containing protein [Tanacetum cinerariifolium]